MEIFNGFPFSNFQQLNLDWIIKKLKELEERLEALEEENEEEGAK